MTSTATTGDTAAQRPWGTIFGIALLIAVLVAMALDTTVVRIGSEGDVANDVFSPDAFAASEFGGIQASVEQRASPAVDVANAIAEDKKAAAEKFGTAATVGHVIPVSFTGTAGEAKSGVYDVQIDGMPEEVRVRLQTGPAINGTDLRDATGKIKFGQFTNQIEYQDAGSALNREMKRVVLSGIDNSNLTSKQLVVTGVFKLVNPKNWFVTPVRLSVK